MYVLCFIIVSREVVALHPFMYVQVVVTGVVYVMVCWYVEVVMTGVLSVRDRLALVSVL
jgi:hypothetical protein